MSDVKLFRVKNGSAEELQGYAVKLKKKLQTLIEKHLETFLHIRFVASEYSTGKTHAGRIDTLGIDENFCPTIIEYKRNSNANVINQGLFYLDWLMDHKAEFKLLVQRQFGLESAEKLDWSGPRLLCIAEDFTRYDIRSSTSGVELCADWRLGGSRRGRHAQHKEPRLLERWRQSLLYSEGYVESE